MEGDLSCYLSVLVRGNISKTRKIVTFVTDSSRGQHNLVLTPLGNAQPAVNLMASQASPDIELKFHTSRPRFFDMR